MLSNFYQDNAYIMTDFAVISNMQKGIGAMLTDHTEQLSRNRILTQVETYRVIPFQHIAIDSATYDIQILLTNSDVINILGASSKTLDERILDWKALRPSVDKIMDALDMAGCYVELISVPVYPFQGYPVSPPSEVITMDLYSGEDKLQIGVDFEIRKNRLYILNEDYGNRTMSFSRTFSARDIAIDCDTVRRNFGSNIDLPKYPDLSKDVFNEIFQKLIMSILKGPTISNIKSGISAITNTSTENSVCDKYSAPAHRQNLWKEPTAILSPFDFLIELPAEFSTSSTLSDIVKRYMDAVKPSDSAYQILLHTVYTELYSRHVNTDDVYSRDLIRYNHGTEIYLYRTVLSQINNPERELNDDFTTEFTHGYSTMEDCESKITYTDTGQVAIVDY